LRSSGFLVLLFALSVVCNLQSAIASPQSANQPAAFVGSVSFSGNRALRAADFALATRSGSPLSDSVLEADRQRILSAYAANGFFWAAVETEQQSKAGKVALVYRISEGSRARAGEVRIAGNRLISGVRLRALLPKYQSWFTEVGITRNVTTLLDFYADNGFPFCSIQPESLTRRDLEVSYVLVINEGPEVLLSDVRFSGHVETRPHLLRRLLGLRLGVPYSETETRRRIARFAADPLLTVRDWQIRRTDRDFWLDVSLQEQKANRVFGSAAWSAEYRELVGQFDLDLANLFGTRRAAKLNWQGSPGRQDFSFSYTEPWLLGTNVDARADVRHRLRDTSYAATNLGLNGRVGLSQMLALDFETGWELIAAGAGMHSARTWWVGSGLSADNRDSRANPTRGAWGSISTRFGARTLDSTGRQNLVRGLLDAAGIVPFSDRLNLSLAGHLRTLFATDTVFDYDRYELGGANSMRGYREGELRTALGAWLNTELRYLVGPTTRVYPFFDCAILQEPPIAYQLSAIAYHLHAAYGAGLRIGSRLGVVGLDYGVPIRLGASPLRGKLHFSLQTDF
jgi:outer membrane protein assembly factor BamA